MALWLLLFLTAFAQTGAAGLLLGGGNTCAYDYSRIYGVRESEARRLADAGGDLTELTRSQAWTRDELAEETLKDLKQQPLPKSTRGRRIRELNHAQLNRLFTDVLSIPQVVETTLCEHYRGSKKKGFCFGRAVAAHLRALQHGIDKRSVRKLWAVGRLDLDGQEWKYHATTIVRVKGEGWYAIDPSFSGPMPVRDWFEKMKEFDPEKGMRLYSTPAARLSVMRNAKYDARLFARDLYNGFFADLMQEIRKGNAREGRVLPVDEPRVTAAQKWLLGAGGVGGISAAGLYGLYELKLAYKPVPEE